MAGRQSWKARIFATAAVALALAVVTPEISPAGASAARVELAKFREAKKATAKAQTQPQTTTRPRGTTPAQKRQRALAAKRRAAQKAAQKRRAAQAALARRRAANNKKDSSLSLPTLALLAVAPFLLIGLYLLGADFLRRRVPRNRGGGTGGASLVITRVHDR